MIIHHLLRIHPKKPQKYQLQQQDFGVRNQWLYLDMSGHVRLRFWECTSIPAWDLFIRGKGLHSENYQIPIDHDISIKIPFYWVNPIQYLYCIYLSCIYVYIRNSGWLNHVKPHCCW